MLEAISQIVRQAGQIILSAHDIQNSVSEKQGIGNFVTTYDVKVQNFLQEKLLALAPDAHFVGEEEDTHADVLTGLAFIVDPIDCTANFVRGMKHSAVSVGVAQDGILQMGVVYNPYRDELFSGKKGCGATCNGQPIHVSDRPLSEGVFCFGTAPYDRSLREHTFRIASRLMERMQDLRRFGSAALDLCDVACGRVDLGFECILQPWDYAAGALIVAEAGGIVTQLDGSPITLNRPCSIVSGNPLTHKTFIDEKLFV